MIYKDVRNKLTRRVNGLFESYEMMGNLEKLTSILYFFRCKDDKKCVKGKDSNTDLFPIGLI